MTNGPLHVRVLVHDLERAGVPIALERTLRHLGDERRPDVAVEVVAERDGPLHTRMADVATSLIALEPRVGRSVISSMAAGTTHLGAPRVANSLRAAAWRRRLRRSPPPDVVVVYGAGAWTLWHALADRPARLVVHLHELEVAQSRCVPDGELGPLLLAADMVLAVCEPIAQQTREAGVAAERILVVPGAGISVAAPAESAASPAASRAVFSIGTPGWRKGTDRAIAIAHELGRSHPDVTYRWIGGQPHGDRAWAHHADLAISWHPSTDDPWATLGSPALVVIPSREDPLPLVVLEAAARSVPVVATATGDLTDLLSCGRGLVVPDGDLPGLVAAVRSCLDDPPAAARRAAALRVHVERSFDPITLAERWWRAVLGSGPPPPS